MRFAPLPEAVRPSSVARLRRALGGTSRRSPSARARSARTATRRRFAGQQESFLWVRGAERSATPCATAGRASTPRGGQPTAPARRGRAEPAMGVTVQLMVDAEVSGVLFTCNPVSGDPSMVAVNASWGLGLAVVGGEVTPDDYLVSKVTARSCGGRSSAKHVEYVPDAAGRGTVRVEVPAERRDEPCLGRGGARRARRGRPARRAPLRLRTRTSSGRSRATPRPRRCSCSRRGR